MTNKDKAKTAGTLTIVASVSSFLLVAATIITSMILTGKVTKEILSIVFGSGVGLTLFSAGLCVLFNFAAKYFENLAHNENRKEFVYKSKDHVVEPIEIVSFTPLSEEQRRELSSPVSTRFRNIC